METIILSILSVLMFASTVLLFFLAVFVVRSQEQTRTMIAQLVQVLIEEEQPVAPSPLRPKTWDEKYEVEIDAAQRRFREASGLTDPG